MELWQFFAASVALFLLIGGYWMYSSDNQITKYVEVLANENKLYLLPDSSKVWMQPGSTIRFAEDFNKDRRVWLKGNSLFEVYRHKGSTFKVYIDKAFIEVKGTCFLIKQNKPDMNEITLFNGNIEFNIEQTGEKIAMKPLQEIIYNPQNAETEMRQVENIEWKNGRYNFTNIAIEKLINTINQMYNANITLNSKVSKDYAFTGSIRHDESLNDVIGKICFTLNLKAKESDKTITIYNQN